MRFFNRSFALPVPKLKDYLNQLPSVSILKERLVKTSEFNIFDIDDESAVDLICMVFEGFNLDLRSVNQIVERVGSILTNHEDELGVILLLTLESLRVKKQSAYDKIWEKQIGRNNSGDNHLGTFIDALKLSENIHVTLSMNKKINHSTYMQNVNDIKKLKDGNKLTIHETLIYLIRRIVPERAIKAKTHEYTSQVAYFEESINDSGLLRFKDYVELAANLS
jgi:virulence-associated protein VapD